MEKGGTEKRGAGGASPQMIEFERKGDVLVARPTLGALLDRETAEKIATQVRAAREKEGVRRVVVDFGQVEIMSSTMIGALVAIKKGLLDAGGDLKICRLNDRLGAIAFVTRLGEVVEYFKTLDEALSSFGHVPRV